ncbi:metallophosphoesterase family protein [Pelagimonas varians]|uniref:Diadenosine tetraphosphatase n=1 Tax=Pelagimonas varians TaxID=696760 RepID=A0A238KBZ7_9RHOB|nr:metallophosphoesterase family protein [Pelagimonas varians]PYG31143.1 serine/threonine protein phosphatase 1 [Pelagimonas varians]SMX39722.1 diadenosine tetraphosphatase [Pelagimonas varians]
MPEPVFVVGDIHGQLDQLSSALEMIDRDDCAGAPVVFVGDYIDRGPDSGAVIETLMRGQAEGKNWTCLLGNHDDYLVRFVGPTPNFPEDGSHTRWLLPQIGGFETLASYGVDVTAQDDNETLRAKALQAIPEEHVTWLSGLPRLYETEDHIFAHAGIRPGVELGAQDPEDLIWIRQEFLNDPRDHGRLVVHGHTAIKVPEHRGNRVNVDGGAGFGRPLYPVLLIGRDAFLLGPFGRRHLEPLPSLVL